MDTGFVIALLDKNDQLHHQANALSDELSIHIQVVTTRAVMLEAANYFSKSLRTEVVNYLKKLESAGNIIIVELDASLFNRGMNLYSQRPDKTWSLTDCISFVVMDERGITDALAHDLNFVQAGKRALLRF